VYTDLVDPLPIFLEDTELRAAIAPRSGLMTLREPTGRELPPSFLKYVLVPRQGTNRLALNGRVLAQSPYLPLTLIAPSQPLRLDWSLAGTTSQAFMTPGAPVLATIYPSALLGGGRLCADFALIGTPHYAGSWPYAVSLGGRTVAHGSIPSQQTIQLSIPLPPRARPDGDLTLTTRVRGQVLYGGALMSAQFANFAVVPCAGAGASGTAGG
jgi:hypothetical protein